MKATDFNFSKEIRFSPESGITSFRNSRLLIFDADALGLLRQKLTEELGLSRTREFFLKFGYQHGYSDFMQMKVNYKFETEMDLLAAGPVIHSGKGLFRQRPKKSILIEREGSSTLPGRGQIPMKRNNI